MSVPSKVFLIVGFSLLVVFSGVVSAESDPPECINWGYADNDFYYLACESEGNIYVYERDTLNLVTTTSLLQPRYMDSYGDLFVSTYGTGDTDTGIAIYDKDDLANGFNEPLHIISHSGADIRTLQPMVDHQYIMVPVTRGADNWLSFMQKRDTLVGEESV